MSRFFQVALYSGGVEWEPPEGSALTVRFGAPGMPAGWYDTITEPDGGSHSAFSVDGNTITVELAEQAVSTPGTNTVTLLINGAGGYQLASWNFTLMVEPVPGLEAPEATVYYNALAGQVAQTLANANAAAASAAQAQQYAESINPAQFATAAQGAKADTAVQSVNGKEGTSVTLAPSDIGAATSAQGALADTAAQSVNGVTAVDGEVTLTAEDVGAQPTIKFKVLSATKGPTVGSNYSAVFRYGQVCFVSASFSLTSVPDAYSRDTVLLSGLPPAAATSGGVVYCQQDGLSHYMQVGTDGIIKLIVSAKKPTVSDPYFWGGFSYPIADGY